MTKTPEILPLRCQAKTGVRSGEWVVYGMWHGQERPLYSSRSVFEAARWMRREEQRLNEEADEEPSIP